MDGVEYLTTHLRRLPYGEAHTAAVEIERLHSYIDWLWCNCKIVYWPGNGEYPIEHNPHADKGNRIPIESAMPYPRPML